MVSSECGNVPAEVELAGLQRGLLGGLRLEGRGSTRLGDGWEEVQGKEKRRMDSKDSMGGEEEGRSAWSVVGQPARDRARGPDVPGLVLGLAGYGYACQALNMVATGRRGCK